MALGAKHNPGILFRSCAVMLLYHVSGLEDSVEENTRNRQVEVYNFCRTQHSPDDSIPAYYRIL